MNSLLIINWLAAIAVIAYAGYLFVYLIRTRMAYIQLGKKLNLTVVLKSVGISLRSMFSVKKLLKDKKSGIIHVMFFYGFILVQFGAIDFVWKGLAPGSHLPLGPLYPAFTFFQEIVTLVILIAVFWAFHRRYVEKLVRLKRNFKSGLVLIFIGGLMISVLLGNGMGLIWHGEELSWSEPIASAIAYVFSGINETVAISVFYFSWWVHLLILLTFLVYVPQSKHAHLIAGPANVFFGRLSNPGSLKRLILKMKRKKHLVLVKLKTLDKINLLTYTLV